MSEIQLTKLRNLSKISKMQKYRAIVDLDSSIVLDDLWVKKPGRAEILDLMIHRIFTGEIKGAFRILIEKV